MSLINLTAAHLRKAADLQERIASLNHELAAILGGSPTPTPAKPAKPVVAKKRGMSAAGKAKVAAAQKLRWAKIHAAKAKPAPAVKAIVKAAKPAKKKAKISPEGMANIIAATKARWARIRAAKAAKKK